MRAINFAILFAITVVQPAASMMFVQSPRTGCIPLPGKMNDQCSYYQRNSDWLPPRYVKAADCICTDDSLNTKEMKCVRDQLQILHDRMFNERDRQKAAEHLALMKNGTTSETDYEDWTLEFFVDRIYIAHEDAYETCCCTGTIASKAKWKKLFTSTPPCMVMRTGQKLFSNCYDSNLFPSNEPVSKVFSVLALPNAYGSWTPSPMGIIGVSAVKFETIPVGGTDITCQVNCCGRIENFKDVMICDWDCAGRPSIRCRGEPLGTAVLIKQT